MPTLNSFLFNTTATIIIFASAMPDAFYMIKTKSNLVQWYMRASIESNGDAKFGNIYSNGSLVTSDRKKKTGVKKLSGTFLDKVRGSAVYRYRLKQDMIPEKNAKKFKRKISRHKKTNQWV